MKKQSIKERAAEVFRTKFMPTAEATPEDVELVYAALVMPETTEAAMCRCGHIDGLHASRGRQAGPCTECGCDRFARRETTEAEHADFCDDNECFGCKDAPKAQPSPALEATEEMCCRCGYPLCRIIKDAVKRADPNWKPPPGPPDPPPHTLKPEGYCVPCRTTCRHGPQPRPASLTKEAVLRIIREQPYAPDTKVGARQQWVKNEIARKVEALPASLTVEQMKERCAKVAEKSDFPLDRIYTAGRKAAAEAIRALNMEDGT